MNLALLAVMLDRRSRSANVGRALRLIDAAARHEPAPDLIVLPSGCDRAAGKTRSVTPAMAESYAASVSAKAREWGVFVAVAQQRGVTGSTAEAIMVVDPDGDEIFVQGRGPAAGAIGTVATAVGEIRMCYAERDTGAESRLRPPGLGSGLLIVFGGPDGEKAWPAWVAESRAADSRHRGAVVFGVRAWHQGCDHDDAILSFGRSLACERGERPEGEILHVTIRTG